MLQRRRLWFGRTNNDIEELRSLIHTMSEAVVGALHAAVATLDSGDIQKAQEIVAEDAVIDRLEQELESRCVHLLLYDPPTRADERSVRLVAAVLKSATDLERAGDHAAGIARTALRIGSESRIRPILDIPRMAQLAAATLQEAAAAFVHADPAAARAAAQRDDAVDALYDQVLRELLTFMLDDRTAVRQATHLLFVASHLERIGDYATNLAEWTIYVETGQRVELND